MFAAPLFIAASFAAGALGQALTINTPQNVVECEPVLITWSGGTPPYFVSVLPGNDPGAAAVISFGQQSGTSLTWPACNETAGTSLGLTIRDSTGATQNSAPFTVLAGSDSCLTGGSSSTETTTGTTTGTTSTTATVTSGTTTTTTGTETTTSPKTTTTAGTTTTTKVSGTSSAPATTTTKSSAALPTGAAQAGVVAVVGAVMAAFIA